MFVCLPVCLLDRRVFKNFWTVFNKSHINKILPWDLQGVFSLFFEPLQVTNGRHIYVIRHLSQMMHSSFAIYSCHQPEMFFHTVLDVFVVVSSNSLFYDKLYFVFFLISYFYGTRKKTFFRHIYYELTMNRLSPNRHQNRMIKIKRKIVTYLTYDNCSATFNDVVFYRKSRNTMSSYIHDRNRDFN